MKNSILTLTLILCCNWLFAQLNMSLTGRLEYDRQLNDVWAWVAPDGTEYALVGTTAGLSIVSLADPSEPDEVAFVEGPVSVWRDIKTWENYAYVSNETGGGIQIIDLSDLPNSVRDTFWTVTVEDRTLRNIHNLYIDSIGYCYVAGSNLNRGGLLIVDVDTDPWNPSLTGLGAAEYAHDVYVRDDLMYVSELNAGRMAIYDISDRTAPLLLGLQNTPYFFTHNIWLSDNGKVAFTTDERVTAPVTAYDVSDPTNIVELDEFRPAATLAQGNIPHNVHVWEDWLILSYYGDGGIIVDASRPSNLVEVGNFDTFFNLDPGQGAWGAYPWLPSGLVLVTDMGNGLFVLEPNYVRAAWLEGKITDASNGAAVNEVKVEILADQVNVDYSNLTGDYKTGLALSGTFDVRFFKQGYLPLVAPATLNNGELTILNVELIPAGLNRLSGITLMEEGGATIDGAQVLLEGEQGRFEGVSNEAGLFDVQDIYEGDYQLYVGSWGYLPKALGMISISKDTALTVTLESGYQDDFFFDFGWMSTIEGEGARGAWTIGKPRGTYRANGEPVNPYEDINGDLGEQCYMTGNGGGNSGTDDVDDGIATLVSPVMDLSNYIEPILTYHLWWYNSGGTVAPDDSLMVYLTNGQDTIVLENLQAEESAGAWREESYFSLNELIELTDSMQLILVTGDLDPNGHLVEAAVDLMQVRELAVINGADEETEAAFHVTAFPNPFREVIRLRFDELQVNMETQVRVFNQIGQQTLQTQIPAGAWMYDLPAADWAPGVYYIRLETANFGSSTVKVVKVR
ncbi:MAG: choice-of-anchor B family protein [Lewinella sp.]|nr:choice-of-anchor B family protein [Lewinella sp.]